MTEPLDQSPEANPYLDQRVPWEWRAVAFGDETLITRSVPEGVAECFRVVGQTRNVRALAHADAVLLDGTVVEPFYESEYRRVLFQHDYSGRVATHEPSEWLASPAVQLERLETIDLTEVLA